MTQIDIIWEIIGFFLQTIPVALLAFIPFSPKEIKIPAKKLLARTLLIEAAASILFGITEYLFDTYLYAVSMNPYMLVYIILMTILFMRIVDAPSINKMMVAIILIHYAAIIFMLSEIFFLFLKDPVREYMYSLYNDLFFLAAGFATAPIVYIFFKRTVCPAMPVTGRKSMRRGCFYAGFALLLFCVALFILDTYIKNESWSRAALILLLTLIITDGIIYYMFFSESRLAVENLNLENQIQSFNDQYRRISSNIEETRRMRHDIRHHLNVISEMNRRGDYEELSKYLESYARSYSDLENTIMTGYSPIDNILGFYVASAKQKNILVKCEFSHLSADIGFEVPDVTAMLGNLMENAIEACERLPEDEPRFIRIRIKQTDASLLLYFENSCTLDGMKIDFTDENSFQSSKHIRSKGQGLRSVRLVAEKYGGSAEYKKEDGVFTARIVLNLP